MATGIQMKSWNENPTFSNRFLIVTKYTDLGSPDGKKSLLGFIFNISVATKSTAASPSIYSFDISYRKGINDRWIALTTFHNVYASSVSNPRNIEIVRIFNSPIKNILNLQLRIMGTGLRNDVGINDMGLIFRTYRDSSVVSLDEE